MVSISEYGYDDALFEYLGIEGEEELDYADIYDTDEAADEYEEPEEITPLIKEMTAAGEIIIEFDPPNSNVPDNWQDLWDDKKRSQLPDAEIKLLETIINQVILVLFVQNSEEDAQTSFDYSIKEFTSDGIRMQLKFSEPLNVSQGDVSKIQ